MYRATVPVGIILTLNGIRFRSATSLEKLFLGRNAEIPHT